MDKSLPPLEIGFGDVTEKYELYLGVLWPNMHGPKGCKLTVPEDLPVTAVRPSLQRFREQECAEMRTPNRRWGKKHVTSDRTSHGKMRTRGEALVRRGTAASDVRCE